MPVLRIPAPNGGLALPAALSAIPKDKAFSINNFLVDQPGKLRTRNAVYDAMDLSAVTATGIWVFGETIMVSATPTAKFLDSSATYPLGAETDVATGATLCLDEKSTKLGAYAYGPATDATIGLLRWGGTAVVPVALTHAPKGAADVCTHLNRLFVAGGSEPNTATPNKPNTLWWTDLTGATTNTLVDWQDDVSGLVNQLTIGDDGDEIVGLTVLGSKLLVFKRNSIWEVLGSTTSQFTVRRVVSTMGLLSKTALLAVDDVCLFINTDGYAMLYDGTSLEHLYPLGSGAVPATQIVRLPGNHFLFNTSGSATQYLLHLPTRAWTTVSYGTGVQSGTVMLVATGFGNAFSFDGRYLRNIDTLTATGSSGRETGYAGSAVAIVPQVFYRLWELDLPLAKAVVRNVFVDHLSLYSAAAGTGTPSWELGLGSYDTMVLTTFPNTYAVEILELADGRALHRTVVEPNLEVTDLLIAVSYVATGGVPYLASAELQDLYVEYEPAQRRRSY